MVVVVEDMVVVVEDMAVVVEDMAVEGIVGKVGMVVVSVEIVVGMDPNSVLAADMGHVVQIISAF